MKKKLVPILTKTFLAIYFIFIYNLCSSQISVFSNTVATACSADFGTVYGATFSRTISATGLPAGGLSAAGIVLREVRVKLGNSGCTGSLSTYSLQIKNPQGVVVTLANGLMTTGVSSWVNMKFRDDVSLERIKEYPAAVQWGYVPHSIGYYALETDGQFGNLFTGLNPNGTWTFEMIEGTTSEVSFEKVEFVFGPDLGVSDVTTCSNNNFCSGASCISNGVYRGNNNGYSQPDAQMPSLTVGGCNWNGANNNSAWFKFQPTSTTAKVTISGMLNSAAPGASDMQPIVLKGNGACITPTLVPTGGCPDDQVTNNTDYITTNGGGSTAANVYVNGISENCEFNLSGLTIGADYYLYVDGNGGVSSFFYIEVENGVNSVCSSCCNITIGGGQSTMCVGDAATTFTQSGGVAGGTWSVVPSSAGTINSSGVFTPTTSAASSINATISYNDGTCSSTRALTVNPIPTASISTPSTLSCIATTITLTGSVGGTYIWSGPGIVSGGSSATPSVNLPGTYNLTVTTNGCSSSTSVSVSQNTVTPSVTMPTTQTLTCAAPTATLIASANPSTCTVVWAGGVTSGVNSYTATTSSATIYTLTVTNPNNGCTNSGTVQVSPSAGFPSVTSNMTNSITCSTTTAQVVASTTTSPVSYSWTGPGTITGANSATATVNAGGTYTCVVTNTSSACSSTTTIFVPTNTTVPTITATNTSTLTCTTLTANLTGTGGGSYNWSGPGITGGGATATPTVNLPGTYNLTVTAANGCTATANTAITQNTTVPTASASNTSTLTCSTTTVQLTGTGGGTYLWSGPGISSGSTTATPIINLPGTYDLTVTAANGCTATATTTITQNTTTPTITVTNATNLTCSTTTAQLTGTGGGNYSWDGPSIIGGQTTATPTVNLPGTYNLTVTAVNGCTATASTAITQNTTSPIITATNASTLTCATTTAQLAGTGGGTYSWSGPGITAGGATATPTVNLPGAYNLTVTAANGCTATASTAITQNTTAPTITATNTSTLTCTTLTANVSGTGGGTYAWSGPGITSGATSSNATVNQPGTYNLTVTAANGCTATANTTITQNTTAPTITASNTSTLTCLTTTASLLGTGGGTYAWSGPSIVSGGTTSTPVVNQGGTYIVTVTAANGCTATANTTITQNTTAPTASATNASTLNCITLTANLTGTGGGTYNWSGPGITAGGATATPTVNLPGTYNLTVTAANGCTATANTTITQNTLTPAVSTATSGVLNCTLTSVNASATTTTSPVNYNWSGAGIIAGGTTSTPTINAGGTYNYTVTNTTNGCQTTGSVAVSQNTTAPSASATGGTLTCATTSTVLTGGPASGVTYSWSGAGLSGATTLANATATATGNYTLTTTASNGCTNTAVATVTNNLAQPTANAGSTQTLVCGVSSVTLTGAGTPLGSTANWLGGVTSPTSFTTTVGAPGTYTLVVTHPTSGCTNTSTVAVSSSTNVPQATVNAITNSITCTNSVVAIGVTLSNTDPVSYTWSGPGISGTNTTATTTATLAGTYSVTITNTVSGCQSTFNVAVPINTTAVVANATASSSITCNTSTMTLAASPTGTNYSYTWSGPGTITNGTTQNPVVNTGGNYVVTITNGNNSCTGSFTVNVPSNTVTPTLTLTPSSLTTTCANPTATLLATSSADPDVNYTWTSPSTGSLNNTTISNPVANGSGVFTVQVTNTVSGCVSAIETVTITADANVPTLNATVSSTAICSGATATLNITGADTYTWSTLETVSTITVSPTGTTTYSATGTNTTTGCSNITNVTVNVTPTPTINVAATATTICEGNSTTLTLTGATNYTVTNPAQTTTGTLTLSPSTPTTYTITGEEQGCASTTETITINVNILPIVSASNATTCAESPVTLTASGADTYTWSTTANTNTTSVSPTTNTTYTVTGTNTVTGCTSTVTTVDITVNQLPTVTASANPNTTCTTGTVNLTANTTATSYTWTLGNGVDNTNQNQGTISFPASTLTTGTYTYTVAVTDVNGCVSPQATTTISIIDVPNANFDLSDLSICQNENGTLTINTPQTGVTYDWNINGQTIPNTNPLTVPSSITNASGTYTVNVIAGIGTCTNTAANVFTVNALPSVALVNPTASACENTTAQLDVAGPNSTYTYNWTNGTNTSTGTNLTVNPLTQATQGTYTVTATDANGCTNRTSGKIDIKLCETFVPEFFSPNGDGKNDGFVIKNIENYPNNQLKIFNRWGNLVYQKDGYLNEFEGYANVGDAAGKDKLPAGTYYVILVYGDEETETYNGYLLLQY